MSGAASRRKGREYEAFVRREFPTLLNGMSDITIAQKNRAGYDGDDVQITVVKDELYPELDVVISGECKNQNRMSLAEWVNQSVEQAPEGEVPVVIHKRKGKGKLVDHYVTMRVRDFIDILERI